MIRASLCVFVWASVDSLTNIFYGAIQHVVLRFLLSDSLRLDQNCLDLWNICLQILMVFSQITRQQISKCFSHPDSFCFPPQPGLSHHTPSLPVWTHLLPIFSSLSSFNPSLVKIDFFNSKILSTRVQKESVHHCHILPVTVLLHRVYLWFWGFWFLS